MAAIRQSIRFPGRVIHFTPASVSAAMEAVRSHKPRTVAIDAVFGQTPMGVAFMDRVDALGIDGSSIKFILEHEGRWITAARRGSKAPAADAETSGHTSRRKHVEPSPDIETASPELVAAIAAAVEAGDPLALSTTRRAPRFAVQGNVEAIVENGHASIVDMSVLGAQLVSVPALRPNQRIMVSLQDSDVSLNVIAQVAWSSFERPSKEVEPYYRAGIEFSGPAKDAIEDYRQRHCLHDPIQPRK